MTYIDLLEKTKGELRIITFLWKNKRAEISKLARDNHIPRETCYAALRKLEEAGLLVLSRERGYPPKVYCQLTQRGEEVAELLCKVDNVLGHSLEGYKRQYFKLKQEYRFKRNQEKDLLAVLRNLQRECYNCGRWDEAITYGKEVVKLYRKNCDYKEQTEALRNIGTIHLRRQEFDKALMYFQKSLNAAQRVNDHISIVSNNCDLGGIFEMKGNYSRALILYERCAKKAERFGFKLERGRAHMGKGRIYGRKGLYKKSIASMKKAAHIFERLDDKEELLKAYTSLGSTEYHVDMDSSIKWQEKCIKTSEMVGNIRTLGYALSNAASCYIKKMELKKAELYLERALPIFKKLNDKMMVSSILTHFARIHRLKKQWKKALDHLGGAMKIAKSIRIPSHTANIHFQHGLVYKDMRDNIKAKRCLERALKIYKDLGSRDLIRKVSKELEEIVSLQKSQQRFHTKITHRD